MTIAPLSRRGVEHPYYLGKPHLKPLIFLLIGASSHTVSQLLSQEFKIKVLRNNDLDYRDRVVEGVKKLFNLIIDVQKNVDFFDFNDIHDIVVYTCDSDEIPWKVEFRDRLEQQSLLSQKNIFDVVAEENGDFRKLWRKVSKIDFDPATFIINHLSVINKGEDRRLKPHQRQRVVGIDTHTATCPYTYTEVFLENKQLTGASHIWMSDVDPSCPDFIATHSPFCNPYIFWSLVHSLPSTCVIQLNHEQGSFAPEQETTYNDLVLRLIDKNETQANLVEYTLFLKKNGEEKQIKFFWINNWNDGCAPPTENSLDLVLDRVHHMAEENPLLKPVVFCKAGIGRTGTFLANYLIKHLIKWSLIEYKIELEYLEFQVIVFLRIYRYRAVQSLQQVQFLMSQSSKYLFG